MIGSNRSIDHLNLNLGNR